MVIDTLENFGKYVSLNPLFATVAEYMKENDIFTQEVGKIRLDGEDLFVNYAVAKGKTVGDARIETHNRMIDIQIPLSCPETMGYTPRKNLPKAEYNEEKDITFYSGEAEKYITVNPGEFVIFFPEDGHAPCVSDNLEIRKAIFKVKA